MATVGLIFGIYFPNITTFEVGDKALAFKFEGLKVFCGREILSPIIERLKKARKRLF